jgi:uncharacterized protein YecE (DUF72 family)
MTKFYVGTAGWSYKDWEGIVYPTHQEDGFHALPFLAKYINIVEVNSTFYRPPVTRITLSWIKRVQEYPEFLFAVKLHQSFTHEKTAFSQKDSDEFKFGIDPLRAHSRLAAILIQFPWSFKNTGRSREHLERIFHEFKGYPMALEIRHGSWNRPDFFQWLQDQRVGFCNIDQPVINDSLEPIAVQTHPEFSYVRLHGRNYKNWFSQSAGRDARYNYLYSGEELDEWIGKIKDLGKSSPKIFIISNNHYQGQALANALQIKNKLTGEKLDVPLDLLKRYPMLREIITKIEKDQLNLFDL